ncbi:MAG: hypothetical protein Q4A71_04640 [Actinomycetaceae bacterium]|nr:hypothetical protein [Actinomycetaceae bacterium]
MSTQFRRPAMLGPEDAENIAGDYDPATRSDVAHTSAQLLTDLFRGDSRTPIQLGEASAPPAMLRPRLRDLVASGDVDIVAELWARQPANTLPGALWRVFLLREWMRRDPRQTSARYMDGLNAPPDVRAVSSPPTFDQVRSVLEQILQGPDDSEDDPTDWLAKRLAVAAAALRVFAAGAAGTDWITDQTDDLADQVTLRAGALAATASEMKEAAVLAKQRHLE